jgi:thioredoxin reductase
MIWDALIIGGGPAGLSAALALGRVCRTALVLDSGIYRNEGVTAMHTVLSRDGTRPADFRNISIEQIKKYPTIHFEKKHVISINPCKVEPTYQGFEAIDNENNTIRARKLVMATGTEDIMPDVPGYRENWPEHIYQCLFCDGFEQKEYPGGIFTFPDASYTHLALTAIHMNPDITIYSNGPVSHDAAVQRALATVLARGVKLDIRRVKAFVNNGPGPERGITVQFQDGSDVTLGMLVHKPAMRNRAQLLLDQLGLATNKVNGEIITGSTGETSVPGCFAAGDTAEVMKQVAFASWTGMCVGSAGTTENERRIVANCCHLRCESRSNAEYAALCRGRSGCFDGGGEGGGGGVVGEALKESYYRNLGACRLFWRMEDNGEVLEKYLGRILDMKVRKGSSRSRTVEYG